MRTVSGRSWNNCILEHSSSNSHTKDHNQSHSILVDENQSTCTSNHSNAPSVANILDSMDTQLHYTTYRTSAYFYDLYLQ